MSKSLKSTIIAIGSLILLLLAVSSCGDKGTSQIGLPSLSSITYSGCKTFMDKGAYPAEPTQSCIEYSYDGHGRLQLKHSNTLLNCCLDGIAAEIELDTGMIWITEYEIYETSPCYCLCYYDVDLVLEGIYPGYYGIQISSKSTPSADPFSFVMDLTGPAHDTACFDLNFIVE